MKSFLAAALAMGMVELVSAQAVIPGWLTDPTNVRGAFDKESAYKTPEPFKYPYISTYYVTPTVSPDEEVKVGVFVTDFDSSKIRFLDDSHRFTAFLEYRPKGGASKVVTLKNLRSGDAVFKLGKLPRGDYEFRVWAKDAKGRESHRVIQDFRVRTQAELSVPADKVYRMTASDLTAYGIRNDGDIERIVYVGSNGTEVVKEKRAGVPGYTVTVPLDPKTDKVPYRAYEKASVAYDAGFDKAQVEATALATTEGLQKLIDDKAAAGIRRLMLLPGTYRVSHKTPLFVPDHFTLDLGKATLKLNAFTGEHSLMVRIASSVDAHVVGGTLEGDYWSHDYKNSPKDSEWVSGFEISGDSWYSSFENVKVVDITGYGGQNGIHKDKRGDLAFIYEYLPKFAPGGLDPKTGEIDPKDTYRFTTDFKDLKKIVTGDHARSRLQICKYLGYQGVRTRSWQMTVAWYDAAKKFISAETCFQFREMWIPEGAAFLRVSVEEGSVEAANKSELVITGFRIPINCAVKNCTFDHCRCVGYAASQMRNMLFEGNFFTRSGEAEARCAFDAEDGADQMQDVYFLRNRFRDNPINNSILTCSGHNFILEKNDGGIHFWGRTNSPCVRDNDIDTAEYWCDSRMRSGYGRFENNRYRKSLKLGQNEMKQRPDNWDYVISKTDFDAAKAPFSFMVGKAGRVVGCTFRDFSAISLGTAYACSLENCKGWFSDARWVEVTAKDCAFKGFYFTNSYDRCHFDNVRFDSIDRTAFNASKCEFKGCRLGGFNEPRVRLTGCTFVDSAFGGGWNWERPATMLFRNCKIKTCENQAFLSPGVYAIGKIGFDGCTVTGQQPLVHVKDIRPHNEKDPAKNPDSQPGTIAFRNTVWQSEAKTVVTHGSGKHEAVSTKRISFVDKGGNKWPAGIELATDLFPTWEVK